MAISVGAALVRPIGLPMTIGEHTQKLYNYIESLPAGSIVFLGNGLTIAQYSEIGYTYEAVIKHLFDRPLRFVAVSLIIEGPVSHELAMSHIKVPQSKVYGTDYVVFGFVSGGETAYAAIGGDTHAVLTSDYKGTPVGQIPLMKDVKSAQDFALIVDFIASSGSMVEASVRQWGAMLKRPLALSVSGLLIPTALPYYPNQVIAVIQAIRGGGEYELITKHPSYAAASSDAVSISHIIVWISLLVANVGAIGSRMRKGRK